jgi:CRISPR-associated protein Cmr2
MIFDYYASMAGQKDCSPEVDQYGLASGFVDRCAWAFASAEIDRMEAEQKEKEAQRNSQEEKDARKKKKEAENVKNNVRDWYMKRASGLEDLQLPTELNLEPNFSQLPDPSWFGIEVEFELLSPWHSKDDRPFHVLDNPVRKDRVFGVPFMSASSWKGLLRWACRMQAGLFEHLKTHDMKLEGWKDPAWIVHLFGNERGEGEEFSRGALIFCPTWFSKVRFEVINPHKRGTRAGTQPIYYEVVSAETERVLRLLYAPLPGQAKRLGLKPKEAIEKLIDAIEKLLETYGISAKRTSGWGKAKITSWKAIKDSQTYLFPRDHKEEFKQRLTLWLSNEGE